MSTEATSLLGKGPSFPYNKAATGGLLYTEDIARINQSLQLIFNTPKNSRLMLPDFGSDIRKYRFDPLDKVLMEKLRYTIREDVKKWEPRISLASIEFLADSQAIDRSILYISLTYNIINTDVKGNFVYPYKIETYSTYN